MARRAAQSIPRYRVIESAVRSRIESGEYAVGDELPSEHAMCKEFEASRFTVREALRRIEDAGYIKRHQGAASRIVSRWPHGTFVLSGASESPVLRYVATTVVKFRKVSTPMPRSLARELGVTDVGAWLHYSGLRYSSDTGLPVADFDTFIRREYEIDLNGDPGDRVLFSEVVDTFGLRLAYIDQTISAAKFSARAAKRLGAKRDDPALRMVRMFVADDVGMFQVSVSFNRADSAEYHLRLARSDYGSGPG